MKKLQLVLILILPFLLSAATDTSDKTMKEIKVAAFNYYPGIFKDDDGEIKGFIVDILEEIAKRENWDLTFVYGSWDDCLKRITNNSVQVLTSAAFTEERNEFMDYTTNSILTVWGGVYTQNGSTISSINDLKNKKIAVMTNDFNGASFIHLIESFHLNCEVVELPGFDSIFDAIKKGDVDAGVANNIFGTAKQNEYDLKSTGIIFNPFDIYFTVAKNQNSDILKTLDKYLAKWKFDENSLYHSSLHKWSQKDVNLITKTPTWLTNLIGFLLVLFVMSVLFIFLLRKKVSLATKEILRSEEKYRNRFEYFPFPSFIWTKIDDDFEMTVANKAAYEESDKKIESIFGIKSRILWKDEPDLTEYLFKCFNSKETFTIEREYTFRANKKTKFVSSTYSFLPPDNVQITVVDITAQRKSQTELVNQRNLFETMFNAITEGVVITDVNRNIILANKGIKNTFGYEPEEVLGKSTKIFYADESIYEKAGKEIFSEKAPVTNKTYSLKYKHKNNNIFSGETFGTKLYNEKGEWIGNLGILRDITERQQLFDEIKSAKEKAEISEEELREKHFELLQAQKFAKIGNWKQDLVTNKLTLSETSYEIFGIDKDDKSFEDIFPLIHPDDKQKVLDAIKASSEGKNETDHIVRIIRPDGKLIYLHDHWLSIYDSTGKEEKRIGTHQDITELKVAEEKVKANEIKQRSLIANISDVIVIIDKNDLIDYKSPNITENFGWLPEDLIGKNALFTVHPEDYQKVSEELIKLKSDPNYRLQENFRYKCKDGSYKFIELTGVNLLNDPIIKGIVANYKDISERKNAERAVIENQRLSAVGEIASSVAHDFNNSLQSILGNLELIELKGNIPQNIIKYLESIKTATIDSAQRVKLLQRFSGLKQNSSSYQAININKIIEDVIVQTRPLWKNASEKKGIKISIVKEFKDLPSVSGNEGELRTVLYNVIKNSVEAMPKGGEILISTYSNDNSVKIEIADSGIGMDENTKTRIFQPFFTTKGFEQGRGMGMSGAYSIINEHKGSIEIVNSSPGEGTTIGITLPICLTNYSENETTIPEKVNNSIRILWIDDDTMIREIATEMIIHLGHKGDVAESGEAALALLKNNQYDLIITDIGMPDMNGWQLIEKVKEKFGDEINIAVLSGWSDQLKQEDLRKHNITYTLSKPFKISQFQELISEIQSKV